MSSTMKFKTAARLIREAFEEGWESYETPCSPFSTREEAWEDSSAKITYDELMAKV